MASAAFCFQGATIPRLGFKSSCRAHGVWKLRQRLSSCPSQDMNRRVCTLCQRSPPHGSFSRDWAHRSANRLPGTSLIEESKRISLGSKPRAVREGRTGVFVTLKRWNVTLIDIDHIQHRPEAAIHTLGGFEDEHGGSSSQTVVQFTSRRIPCWPMENWHHYSRGISPVESTQS